MMLDVAQRLLLAIDKFDIAADGESNDDEHDAASELSAVAMEMLREISSRDIAIAEMLDENYAAHEDR